MDRCSLSSLTDLVAEAQGACDAVKAMAYCVRTWIEANFACPKGRAEPGSLGQISHPPSRAATEQLA